MRVRTALRGQAPEQRSHLADLLLDVGRRALVDGHDLLDHGIDDLPGGIGTRHRRGHVLDERIAVEVVERQEAGQPVATEPDAHRHGVVQILEVVPRQHRDIQRLARFQHGGATSTGLDERALVIGAHVLEIDTGKRWPARGAVERTQAPGRGRREQDDALAPVDLVEQHLALVAVEMEVRHVASVGDEGVGRQIVVAVLAREGEDLLHGRGVEPAGRWQREGREDARRRLVLRATQARRRIRPGVIDVAGERHERRAGRRTGALGVGVLLLDLELHAAPGLHRVVDRAESRRAVARRTRRLPRRGDAGTRTPGRSRRVPASRRARSPAAPCPLPYIGSR